MTLVSRTSADALEAESMVRLTGDVSVLEARAGPRGLQLAAGCRLDACERSALRPSRRRVAKHLSHLRCELPTAVRLAQQLHSRIQPAAMHNGILRVA
jgi:hypothetical protein